MDTVKISALRRNMRRSDLRIRDYCRNQVPTEIFHYTLSQMRAIDTLYNLTRGQQEGIQLKVLAENLDITPAAASEMVDTLVRKGAIIRKVDPADRRAVRLHVGDSLRERFEDCDSKLDELLGNFLRTLPENEIDAFCRVTEKFCAFTADPDNFPEVGN